MQPEKLTVTYHISVENACVAEIRNVTMYENINDSMNKLTDTPKQVKKCDEPGLNAGAVCVRARFSR